MISITKSYQFLKTHDSDGDHDGVVNFQLDLKSVEELVNTSNSGTESLRFKIQDLRNKFGDDIIE